MFCYKCYKEKDEEAKYEMKDSFVLGSRSDGMPIRRYIETFICEECFIEKKKWFDDCEKFESD